MPLHLHNWNPALDPPLLSDARTNANVLLPLDYLGGRGAVQSTKARTTAPSTIYINFGFLQSKCEGIRGMIRCPPNDFLFGVGDTKTPSGDIGSLETVYMDSFSFC
jgi:hypothetical protein